MRLFLAAGFTFLLLNNSGGLLARPTEDSISKRIRGVRDELRDRVHVTKRDLGKKDPKVVTPEDEDLYPLIHNGEAAQFIINFDDILGEWKRDQFKTTGTYQANSFTIRTPMGFEFPDGLWIQRRASKGIWDKFGIRQNLDIPLEGYHKGTIRIKGKVRSQSKPVDSKEKLAFPFFMSFIMEDSDSRRLEWNQKFFCQGSQTNPHGRKVVKDRWFKKTFVINLDKIFDPQGNVFTPTKIVEARLYGQGWDYEFWSYPVSLSFD